MKKTWVKILIAALAVAVLAAAAAIALDIRANRRGKAAAVENSILYFYSDTEGSTRFLVDTELISDRIGGYVDSFLTCNGEAGVARAGTGLYRIDKDGITLIYPAGVDRALLSLDNEVVVFTTATEAHIYDHRTGKVEDIKPDSAAGIPSIVISPDGKTVGYTVRDSDGKYTSYAYENGESRVLADSSYLVAVSDGAEFWYCVKPADASLLYCSEKGEKKIGENVSGLIEFNRDLTETAFDSDGVTYYSIKGSAAKAIVDGASVFSTVTNAASVQCGEECSSKVLDCSTMFNRVFYSFRTSSTDDNARTAYDIWFVNGHRHVTALVKGAFQFYVNEQGTKLACLVDKDVYTMDSDDPKTAEKVCTNVYSFNVSKDGSRFYCIGYDRGLYYVEGTVNLKIAEGAVYSVMTPQDKCLFMTDYDTVGTLRLADGRRPVQTISENVVHFEVMPKVCCYYTGIYEDEYGSKVYDVYTSEDGANFTLTLEAARMRTEE